MLKQLEISFEAVSGETLAEVGCAMAVEHADQRVKDWSKTCWQLFLVWLRRNVKQGHPFMIEDFRQHVDKMDLLEMPPSKRAFGFISTKAKNEGWIRYAGTRKVKNPKAHGAIATLWMKG